MTSEILTSVRSASPPVVSISSSASVLASSSFASALASERKALSLIFRRRASMELRMQVLLSQAADWTSPRILHDFFGEPAVADYPQADVVEPPGVRVVEIELFLSGHFILLSLIITQTSCFCYKKNTEICVVAAGGPAMKRRTGGFHPFRAEACPPVVCPPELRRW